MLLVVGGSGFLGPALRAAAPERDLLFTHNSTPVAGSVQFDLRTGSIWDLIAEAGKQVTAALILAGITNIDACARDPEATAEINVASIRRIVDELRALGIVPVFTSSDAVFDGSHGMWREQEPVAPVLTYGRQKREVERHLESLPPPWLALRLPKLISDRRNPRCMVNGWITALGREERILCATDNYFTPADAGDVARAMLELVDRHATGLFHLGGPERVGRRGLLAKVVDEYQRFAVPKAQIVDCSLRDIPVLEKRPLDTSMDSGKFVSLAGPMLRPASEIARLAVRDYFRGQA